MNQPIKLTQYSHGSGCGCKIAPESLQEILKSVISEREFKHLLVGNNTADDAAVVRLDNGLCLISTVDFFMPVVDDAFDFGAIAAANSLSDVYAMGGQPILAIAIMGWPLETLGTALASEVLKGALSICTNANIPLAGGHTIDSKEPFFGLSVNGIVNERDIKRNHTVQDGDMLFLTKPLGTGTINTALKRGLVDEDVMKPVITSMKQLNSIGADIASLSYVHAVTDVTGFGLIGHLLEMITPDVFGADIYYHQLHFFEESQRLARQFVYADNTMRNWKAYSEKVDGISSESLVTLCDPQTSGGLLIAVDKDAVNSFKEILIQHGLQRHIQPIGQIIRQFNKPITIRYQ